MSIRFSELAAKYALLNAYEMAGIRESVMERYLCDGEGPSPTAEEAAYQNKHLEILSDLYHQKGGWVAEMTQKVAIPPNTQVDVEARPQNGFLGYVFYQRHNIESASVIPISTGDSCRLPAEDVELVPELARACSVAPRDFTLEEKQYILNYPDFRDYLLISFDVRQLTHSADHWTAANTDFMEQLIFLQKHLGTEYALDISMFVRHVVATRISDEGEVYEVFPTLDLPDWHYQKLIATIAPLPSDEWSYLELRRWSDGQARMLLRHYK